MFDLLDEAMHNTVRSFRSGDSRGAAALAPIVNMHAGTLANKVNPANDLATLTVRESVAIQHVTRDFQILHAEAQLLRHICVPQLSPQGVTDADLLRAYTLHHKDIGEHAAVFHRVIDDRRVTRAEYHDVSRCMYQVMQSGMALLSRMEQMIVD